MTLNYLNPEHWGKSPLTDRALRIQQLQAENTEESPPVIEPEFDEPVGVWRDGEYVPCSDEEEPYPPFTGTEFLATHSTIDDHPYSAAFGQFLGNGIEERYCKYSGVW